MLISVKESVLFKKKILLTQDNSEAELQISLM